MAKKARASIKFWSLKDFLINFPSMGKILKKNSKMQYSRGFSHPECDLASPTDGIKYCKKWGFGVRRARLYRKTQ